MKSGFKVAMVLVLIICLAVMPGIVPVAMASWSGSQTITWELQEEWITIYTSVLDYGITDSWHLTLVVDRHPTLGTDIDLSTTLYVPFRDILYTTVGVRRGLFDSDTPTVPYVSVTAGF